MSQANWNKFALVLFLLSFTLSSSASNHLRLHVNAGHMVGKDSVAFPYLSYNVSSEFDVGNHIIKTTANDSLRLTLINNDSVAHGFAVKGFSNQLVVNPSDSGSVTFFFDTPGTFIYYDPANNGKYSDVGLSGIIHIKDPSSKAPSFYWNIKEHSEIFNRKIISGDTVDWATYYPQYFTINGRSNPNINNDSNARVVGSVGDTIIIHMVNTGSSAHSIHFHGYHAEIIQSSKAPNHVGRSKDTFPIYDKEVVVVRMIPHQTGEYPVHDHNLVAVTGGGIYPNGMFLTFLIN